MAPHSSTLAWKIPWMEEPGRLQSMGSLRVRHDRVTSLSIFTFMHWRRKWQPTPVYLPGEAQGPGSLVGCRLWGPTESKSLFYTSVSLLLSHIQGYRYHLSKFHIYALVYCIGREGNGTPLQHSCLENRMDGGAWWTAIHGVTKTQSGLSNFPFTFHFPAL